MNKKMAILAAVICCFFIISFGFLEYKIATKKSNTTILLTKGICLELPVNCVQKMNKKGLTLFCKGGESANIKNLLNLNLSADHKKKTTNIEFLNIYKNEKLSDNNQSNHLIYSSSSPMIFEITTFHKGRKSFLINEFKDCSETVPSNTLVVEFKI